MGEAYSSRPDLMDAPLSDPELRLFTDRSSFIQNEQPKGRFIVTTANDIIQAEALPQGCTMSWTLGIGPGIMICKGKVGKHLYRF
jgi:hypothetical protein